MKRYLFSISILSILISGCGGGGGGGGGSSVVVKNPHLIMKLLNTTRSMGLER